MHTAGRLQRSPALRRSKAARNTMRRTGAAFAVFPASARRSPLTPSAPVVLRRPPPLTQPLDERRRALDQRPPPLPGLGLVRPPGQLVPPRHGQRLAAQQVEVG